MCLFSEIQVVLTYPIYYPGMDTMDKTSQIFEVKCCRKPALMDTRGSIERMFSKFTL